MPVAALLTRALRDALLATDTGRPQSSPRCFAIRSRLPSTLTPGRGSRTLGGFVPLVETCPQCTSHLHERLVRLHMKTHVASLYFLASAALAFPDRHGLSLPWRASIPNDPSKCDSLFPDCTPGAAQAPIREYDRAGESQAIDLSLRAWAPVHDSMERVMGQGDLPAAPRWGLALKALSAASAVERAPSQAPARAVRRS